MYTQSHCEKNLSMKKSTTVLCYTVYLCVCSILLLKGSTPDINNSSSHTLGALYHVVVVTLLEFLVHSTHTKNATTTIETWIIMEA